MGAGKYSQGENSISIGNNTGQTNQGSDSISIGYLAGSQQANNSIVISALGSVVTGDTSNATYIAPLRLNTQTNLIGYNTITKEISFFSFTPTSIPNGNTWGQSINWNDSSNQWQITGNGPLAFGNYSGELSQSTSSIAMGLEAGRGTQGSGAIALGFQSGRTSQGTNAISVGIEAGELNQGQNAISFGNLAGQNTQGSGSIAVGFQAGRINQRINSISIGTEAGENSQTTACIAIGFQAGFTGQGTNSIAIGNLAGYTNQSNGSIAIGYLAGSNQASNSLIISALGTVVTGDTSNATYIAPIRNITQTNVAGYNSTLNEISYFPLNSISNVLFYCDFARTIVSNTLSAVRIYIYTVSGTSNVIWTGYNWLSGTISTDASGSFASQLSVPIKTPNWLRVYLSGWKCGSTANGQGGMTVTRSGTIVYNRNITAPHTSCNQFTVPFIWNDFQAGDIITFQISENSTSTYANGNSGRIYITT